MTLAPRYGDEPVLATSGAPEDQLEPLRRQRRRLEQLLHDLRDDEWQAQSRCHAWTVKDVVAHLAGVNRFWAASARAGLAGTPTRYLESFDPVATPEAMVATTRAQPPSEVLEAFEVGNTELLGLLEGLDDVGWGALAEAPPGHLPIRLLASHALWDAWVHERDVALPLGRTQPLEDDEVRASLRYVAALICGLGALGQLTEARTLGVAATEPDVVFVLDLDGRVSLHDDAPAPGVPTLSGGCVTLLDALSTRVAFPEPPPEAWRPVLEAFARVFAVAS